MAPRWVSGRLRAGVVGMCVVVAVGVVAVVLVRHLGGTGSAVAASTPGGAGTPTSTISVGSAPTSTGADPTADPTADSTASTTAAAPSAALRRLTAAVGTTTSSSTSVAALDVTTGRRVGVGAGTGMTTASIAKLQLLETLLLQHQRDGTALDDDETDTVTEMIEHSSNDAADDTFYDIGDRATVVSFEAPLGLSTARTVPGNGVDWGLTTTGAADQLVLLGNLVRADSPLDAASRAFAVRLMRHVESDQRWGVPAAALGDGPAAAVKNGWLAVDTDDGRWAVNSLGVITVGGDTVLVAVMTQHDASFDAGIARVETLAKTAVAAVT